MSSRDFRCDTCGARPGEPCWVLRALPNVRVLDGHHIDRHRRAARETKP